MGDLAQMFDSAINAIAHTGGLSNGSVAPFADLDAYANAIIAEQRIIDTHRKQIEAYEQQMIAHMVSQMRENKLREDIKARLREQVVKAQSNDEQKRDPVDKSCEAHAKPVACP